MKFLNRGPLAQKLTEHLPGAIATFAGIIRADKSENKAVSAIEYSAHEPMAEKIFQQIHDEILKRFDIQSVNIKHSVGLVKAGETSMIVEVHSKHRAAAFEALRETVELIKARAPVWKKEIYDDGEHEWMNAELMER